MQVSQWPMALPPSPTFTNPDMILPLDQPVTSPDASPVVSRRPQQLPSPPTVPVNLASSPTVPTDFASTPTLSSNLATPPNVSAGIASSPNGFVGLERKPSDAKNRLKHPPQSLSPFRNGILSAHAPGAPRLRSNSERGTGRIRFENSRLSFRPNGSPSLKEEENAESNEEEEEEKDDDFRPATFNHKRASILDEDESAPDSHAAMTRRAEEILANAKKRLTNMEGNLHRARSVVGSRPSSSLSFTTQDGVSQYSPRQRHGSFSTSRQKDDEHQGHARFHSETSVPSSLSSAGHVKGAGDHSAERWFWSGLARSTSLMDRHRPNGLTPLNEDGPTQPPIQEAIREEEEEQERISQTTENRDISPASSGLSRAKSTTQMRELREQMTDLKGKISSLKQQARADSLRRRSLQSLRTPSPLNNANHDWSGVRRAEYPSRAAGLGLTGMSIDERRSPPEEHERAVRPATAPPGGRRGDSEERGDGDSGVELQDMPNVRDVLIAKGFHTQQVDEGVVGQFNGQEVVDELDDEADHEQDMPEVPATLGSTESSEDEPVELAIDPTETQQDVLRDEEDILGEEPVLSHEDREDAFDYEHFFLTSSMGHYNRDRNRDSVTSSIFSQETEKPDMDSSTDTSPVDVPGEAQSLQIKEVRQPHERQKSSESVSSVGTFATATEGGRASRATKSSSASEDGQEEDEDDWTPRQTMVDPAGVNHIIAAEPLPQVRVEPQSQQQEIEIESTSALPARSVSISRRIVDRPAEITVKKHRREHSVTDSGVSPPLEAPHISPFTPDAEGTPPQPPPKNDALDILSFLSSLPTPSLPTSPRASPSPNTSIPSGTGPITLGESDKALAERVVHSLAKICRELAAASSEKEGDKERGRGGKYEARVCRRRLDMARRGLDGEVNGEAF